MLRRLAIALLLPITLMSASTWAADKSNAIFFLNLNDAPEEVQTARAEAERLGRPFITFPEAGKTFSEVEWKTKMASLRSQGYRFSSLMMSGHFNGYEFWGNDSHGRTQTLMKSHLPDILGPATQDVHALYFVACTTGWVRGVRDWKQLFPHSKMILAFAGIGPSKVQTSAHALLTDAMSKEKSLIDHCSMAEAIRAFNQLKDVGDMNVSLTLCDHYVRHGLSGELWALKDCPRDQVNLSYAFYNAYKNYLSGEGTPPPGVNLSDTSVNNPIRQMYNLAKQVGNGECNGYCDMRWLPDSEQSLRLLFEKQIRANAGLYFHDDIVRANALCAKVGIKLPNFAGGSRWEASEMIDNLLSGMTKYPRHSPQEKELAALRFRLGRVYDCEGKCVPPMWVDAYSSREKMPPFTCAVPPSAYDDFAE